MRATFAEAIGTAFLLMAVVGSGIAAQRLSPGDAGLALLENALVTGAALVAIIAALGPVSGAHLNPVITFADWRLGGMSGRRAVAYAVAQLVGAGSGAMLANLMFGLPAVQVATTARATPGLWLSEVVATFGLALVVFGAVRSGRTILAPFAVGAYIAAAYFFTSSTSFANPAVTLARTLSDTFTGIAPSSVPAFLIAQLVGGILAVLVVTVLYPRVGSVAERVVLPHQ